MADPFSSNASDPYAVLARRVREALDQLAPAAAVSIPPEADFTALTGLFGDNPPMRILDVGGGAGGMALMLALAFPHAHIIAIDPDERIETAPGAGMASISWTALSLAQAAAQRLGVGARTSFSPGAFAAAPARPGQAPKSRAVGQEICARESDFDLILLDGPPDAEARAADLRLAASALAPQGFIAVKRVIGADAALVRAGVFEFLRYNPSFNYLHSSLSEGQAKLGLLRHRGAGWFPGFETPRPARPEDLSPSVRDALVGQIGLIAGERPVLEASVGAAILQSGFRGGRGVARSLRLSINDATARFFDPVIDQIFAALDQAPGSILVSSDLADFASDE